jgi:hypothetical protein
MPDDIPATLPNRGDAEGPRSRGVLGLITARWAQIAEPFRETDFEQQEPWFDPAQFDPPRQSA